jgi:YegS/Rv2252/BmrU family lipid kinase
MREGKADNDNGNWLVLVNPHAGGKKAEKVWPGIRKLLVEAGFDIKCVFTEYRGHATQIVRKYIAEKGFEKIIAVGGDGTFNEVVNGIFSQTKILTSDITLGMITVGTGNDWGRMYGFPEGYKEQIEILKKGKTFLQDTGKVYYKYDKIKKYRYFVNIAGMGYDALVVKKTDKMKQKGGGGSAFAYLLNLLAGLFQFKNVDLAIESNGKTIFRGKVFSMSIGICKYNGGGMMQLPGAVPDDGLLDLTVIAKTTKWRVIKSIKKLYDGSFTAMPEVSQYRGKMFTVTSFPHNALNLETDGELLGHSPLVFEILPKSLCIVVP